MAIGTDALIDFFGTQDTVTAGGGTSAVSAGAFSASGDVASWTNDDDAPEASMTFTGTFGTAPSARERVILFARLMNVDGTTDNPQPDANFEVTRMGSFIVDTVTTSNAYTIDIDLPNAYTSQVYEFFIKNDTSDSLNAGWTMKITPKSPGPHA